MQVIRTSEDWITNPVARNVITGMRASLASKCHGTYDLRQSTELRPRTWHDLPKPRRMIVPNIVDDVHASHGGKWAIARTEGWRGPATPEGSFVFVP